MMLALYAGGIGLVVGFVVGRFYASHWEDWVVTKMTWVGLRFSWVTVAMLLAIVMVSVSFGLFYHRVDNYLQCNADNSAASKARTQPAQDLNMAQSNSAQANQNVLHVLGEIADFSKRHAGETHPSKQTKAHSERLLDRLSDASATADAAANRIGPAQRAYDKAVQDYPIADCGASP